MKKITLLILFFISTSTYAYKFSIYTDQKDSTKAIEVAELFKKTYPFSKYEIEFEIVQTTAEELNCTSTPGIERLVVCDSKFVKKNSLSSNTDQAFIVRDMSIYGGSGGGIPVMTTNSPTSVMLHEYLHTLGFSDEYTYSAEEAVIYCHKGIRTANMVEIAPNESYQYDAEAKSLHQGDIPWFMNIHWYTKITTGTALGTGSVTGLAPTNTSGEPLALGTPTGLYKGKTCENASPKLAIWHPGGEGTLMQDNDAGIGKAGEEIVAKILESKGVREKVGGCANPFVDLVEE